MVAAGMPSKFKGYLDAVLAVSNGKDEFSSTNHKLAKYISTKRGILYESALREVTRYATAFFKWQEESKVAFIKRKVGYIVKGTDEHIDTFYSLPYLQVIAELLQRGGWMSLSVAEREETLEALREQPDNLSGKLLEDAQGAIRDHKLAHLRAGGGSTQTFPGGRPSGNRKLSSSIRAAHTLVLKGSGKFAYDAEARNELRKLAATVAAELAALDDAEEVIPTYSDAFVHTDSETEERTEVSDECKEETQGGNAFTLSAWDALTRSLRADEVTARSSETVENVPPCASDHAYCADAPSSGVSASVKIDVLREAVMGLWAFQSVGVESFRSVLKCEQTMGALFDATDDCVSFEQNISSYLRRSEDAHASLCVRPHGNHLIQIDDCDRAVLDRLTPFSFLTVETSPESYQCWLALPGEAASERDSVRERLLRGIATTGANGGAYNSLRFPGSRNFKSCHESVGFPLVRALTVEMACFVTASELKAADLLPPVPPPCSPGSTSRCVDKSPVRFPSWERELARASRKADGQPDRSRADYCWCLLALRWGWSEQEVKDELRRVSAKAATAPRHYVETTVKRAVQVAYRF
jgi:hypothetical protein